MSERTKLTVNDVPIELEEFVEGYLFHVTGGILNSLHDTGEIKELSLTMSTEGEGQVELKLNGSKVPLSYFPVEIIISTLKGVVTPLKGVTGEVKTLEMSINA